MAVTIKDVAKMAGVSPSTVSRVLSGHPRISQKTASKVRTIMTELGYHPNMMAKSLVSKTTKSIGVILPKPAEELFLNTFFMELIRGIVSQANKSGYDIVISSGANEQEEVEAVGRLVHGGRIDGAVLLHSRQNDPVVEYLHNLDFPFVLVGRNELYQDVLSVDTDNVQAAYDATRHLISFGHERIGFVSGPKNLIVSKDRMKGYKKAMHEAGLSTKSEWIVEDDFLQESGYRAMSFYMTLPERPTALVVIDDVVSFGVLRGLNELGYKVPEDLCIVSFNNNAVSELYSPPLSSVDIGIYHLGYVASQALIQAIQGDDKSLFCKRHIIPHRLMVRQSSMHTVMRTT
ncbi:MULTISPECIES: LacI family DNA-binding transcriptional regulator [unclassified Paenibacillus]|uniref:LacI family DNA-binding transcriptional regulator n=1 Tax=Paenibacillus provencensis TaxID=441151 RepID=A0ABW3Q4J2_9BACL|nr:MULTISPECIES: LacI family DNA-binding transcriptional regulator [unclassified Paenibacillus]MCM3129260.1 LacI family DNA-binding transcriptional regulator [Paenibacillus sp. MER 78]SFS70611.1 DNA-binding transcriptional regulator, LacI/PurR family [Paenibacillus sp. 453mf]